MSPRLSPALRTALLCVAEILSMTSAVAYPALLPRLRDEWALTNSGAGFISGSFFAGYMLAVPILTSLTDRLDARRIYLFATLLSAAGAAGFGQFANGQISGAVFQALAGAGLAGTYMPGLKILSDQIDARAESRYIAFYTSSFGVGSSLSILAAGALAASVGWRAAFLLLALGPIAAGALVLNAVPARAPAAPRGAPRPRLLDVRGVLANTDVRNYIIAYAAHCFELFGLRSWMVAFFAFSATLHAAASPQPLSATAAVGAINLLGPVASILGNELAARAGRRRTIVRIMIASALAALAIGFTAPLPWTAVFLLMVIYFFLVMADSAALTAGVISVAAPERRGASLALHSFLGFGAAFIAPMIFGGVLDAAGGGTRPLAWG
ncbi:MAG TPA: MFS transporter, partial [Myxococcaceae bacterium]|nr:MFS transporter [Myxococcaceae bacterium]